ncbi:transporter [Fictibacillus iocasae]|uniref:Transporter n=1 Tax=Fictibacillus iocasae TaxID=2715437 RepID=A0ABW2NPQ8_9BACL
MSQDRMFPYYPGFGGGGQGGQGSQFPSPPSGPPGGGGGGGMAPSGPPPSFVPQQSQAFSMGSGGGPGVYAVDPGAVRPCLYQFVYIWLDNGRSFWAWLTFVGRRSVAGFRWTGRRWVYFGVDTNSINSFVCY